MQEYERKCIIKFIMTSELLEKVAILSSTTKTKPKEKLKFEFKFHTHENAVILSSGEINLMN
jgi:hypothetical protein